MALRGAPSSARYPGVVEHSDGEALPRFRYHPDPLATGAFVRQTTTCPACGRERGFAYTGPFYAEDEIEGLCPWCIADGSAARKYDGFFMDYAGFEPVDDPARTDELLLRTPGYVSWQGGRWPSHHGDYCAFLGEVNWSDLEALGAVEDVVPDLAAFRWTREEARQYLSGFACGYLFRCLICGHYRLHVDFP